MAGKNTKPVEAKPIGAYVKWRDAFSPHFGWGNWTDEDSKECRESAVCEALGYIIEETTEGIVMTVCLGHADGARALSPLFIPIGCILERRDNP